jgi:hypothetical protein
MIDSGSFGLLPVVLCLWTDFSEHLLVPFLIDPEDGTNSCSETSAYKNSTPGNNPKTTINLSVQ